MIKTWMFETARAYVGNASAIRDYRTQLRGTKAVWIWLAYLTFLIIMTSAFYGTNSSQGKVGVAVAQTSLKFFYYSLGGLLATIVCIGAPALTASAITLERQRKSLDLLFSAPVSPRYLIIGKMIGSFRYLFMLLVLALPFISIGVVLGGATWGEVFSALWLLILCGMILCGLGILLSALSDTVIAGILYSYLAVFCYLVYINLFSIPTLGGMLMGTMSTGGPAMSFGSREAPWFACLNPFTATVTSGTITKIYGHDVPNWLITTVVSFMITNWFVLGASSALSGKDSRETKTFRIVSLVYMFLIGLLVGQMVAAMLPMVTGPGATANPGPTAGHLIGGILMFAAATIVGFVIYISCYAKEADRKYRTGGLFSLKAAIGGGVEGSLFFSWLLLSSFTVGVLALLRTSAVYDLQLGGLLVWSFGLLTFVWALARWTSAYVRDLRTSRGLGFSLMFMIFGLPVPLLTIVFQDRVQEVIWLWIWYPTINPISGYYWAIGMIIMSGVLTYIGERKRTLKRSTPAPPTMTRFEV